MTTWTNYSDADDATFRAVADRIEAAPEAAEAYQPHGIGLDGRCQECDGPAVPAPSDTPRQGD